LRRGQRDRGSGAVAPWTGVPLNLQMSETHVLIRLLRMYFPRNWEFGTPNPPPSLGAPLLRTISFRNELCTPITVSFRWDKPKAPFLNKPRALYSFSNPIGGRKQNVFARCIYFADVCRG
jgi:hypothetical protein